MLQRHFILGDEWVYYKIYTGASMADVFLKDQIIDLTEAFLKEGIIDKWFFIRYKDPDVHLRLRFHLKDMLRIGELLDKMKSGLQANLAQDLIWKVQLDTYSREIERYGAAFYEEIESLFYINSKHTLSLLSMLEYVEDEDLRWLFGFHSINQILDIYFEADLNEKLRFAKSLADAFAKEFNMDKTLRNQINVKFKKSHQKIIDFVNHSDNFSEYQPIYDILSQADKDTTDLLKKTHFSENVLGSIIHMMMNRLFKSKNRLHELLLYQFLFLYFRAESYQKKYKS